MRFAHVADTHIRNLKYHEEYRECFKQLYKKLRDLKVDYIIHCGDIAHTKTQISPEFVEMCSDFFKNLADIAPTYIILGNHDGNLRNSTRQDALTPIAKALGHSSLYLLKESGEVNLDDNFTINVLSVFDRDNWCTPSNPDRVNIALYHGAVSGVTTDTGWKMENGEDDVNIFDSFDYGFLGDIHKTNQSLDKKGKIRYPGSTVQQNHGETNDKGFLLWDILDKDSYTCEHHALLNPKPFITVKLTPKGRLPNKLSVPQGARLRLLSENSLSLDVVRKAVDVARSRLKPEAVTYLSRADDSSATVGEMTNSLIKEDLRDLAVQEELLAEYLKDYQVTDEILQSVCDLNRKYNTMVEEEEEVRRNVNWRLEKLEWDNLFNYGENNSIDFKDVNGIVGILGKNFSGKSSIIDSILYTLFNTTSKNNRKNLNIINQNKDNCRGYLEISVGTKTYKIERISEKYKKTLKGKTTQEAKTDVNFTVLDKATGEEYELNGLSRNDTDKNIRKVFGTIDDFLLTSMSSQLGSLSYLAEGSTKRKEILAKFLDLEIFEKKFKKAKDDASDLRSGIKRLEGRDLEAEIKEARTEFARCDTLISVKERECEEMKGLIDVTSKEHLELDSKIKSIPTEIIDIDNVNKQIGDGEKLLGDIQNANKGIVTNLKESKVLFTKLVDFLQDFDVASLEEKQQLISNKTEELDKIQNEINKYEDQLERQKLKISLLGEVPCGSEYSHCKFIRDAYAAKDKLNNTLIEVEKLSASRKIKQKTVDSMQPQKIVDYISKYEKVVEKRSATQNEISSMELKLEKNKTKMLKINNKMEELRFKKQEYENNKEAIENLGALIKKRKSLARDIASNQKKYDVCQREIMELYKQNGSMEQKLTNIESERSEFIQMQQDYAASDLFMRCMHSNGISYDIIKKRLPLLNEEISKILTNIVDFEILFDNEDNKLDILIKHPRFSPRPIEMGSGAEKTIAAMAIRLALLNMSTLPKSDFFILDEPGTALDEENMDGFIRILDMISLQFKTVLLISHLDSLKDSVDTQITIEKKQGYAHVNL
tara:strand:+ start:5205 stop:8357 length:3153 start_codon:yes stop_codon:yes gene_type:complete